jgi:GNAT superfamily N-acetyltransferase
MELVAATGELANAAAFDHARLGTLLRARVPPGRPPEIMRDVMEFFASHAASHEHELGWGGWYLVLQESPAGEDGRIVIGTGGFKGPPKSEGSVEIGYSVLPAFQRRGLASEVTRGLISWAFDGARCTCARGIRRRPCAGRLTSPIWRPTWKDGAGGWAHWAWRSGNDRFRRMRSDRVP